MSKGLKQFLVSRLNEVNDPSKGDVTLLQIINILLNKNHQDEMANILNMYYEDYNTSLKKMTDDKINQLDEPNKDNIINVIQNEYKIFEQMKNSVEIKKDNSEDMKKFKELVDNLFDYQNVIAGVYINKTEKFEEKIKEIDMDDFTKNKWKAILMLMVIITAIHLKGYEEKIGLFLDMGLEYSENLQSYADTLDILTNE